MTTPVLADPRRTGSESGRGFPSSLTENSPGLEMPVLFQLADLSQHRVITPPPKPKPERKSSPSIPAAEPPPPVSPSASASEPTTDKPAEIESAADAIPSAPVEHMLLSGVEAASAPAGTPLLDSPTIRERAELRQRRRQAAAKGDWFQTQGKYIVIVFLLALGGTIWLARRGDDSPPSPAREDGTTDVAQDDSAIAPESEVAKTPVDQEPLLATETKQDLKAPASGPVTTAPAAEALVETSPADGADNSVNSLADQADAYPPAGESPQVTLQAPIDAGPEAPQEPSPDASLFPWTETEEERVAARPQPPAPRSSVPMPQPNPHFQARPHAAGAVSPAPSSPAPTGAATNPATTMPTVQGDQAAPAAYPVTDPATYRSYSPPPRNPAVPGAVPATYENRVPTAPRPSGPRYERTGSGLY